MENHSEAYLCPLLLATLPHAPTTPTTVNKSHFPHVLCSQKHTVAINDTTKTKWNL